MQRGGVSGRIAKKVFGIRGKALHLSCPLGKVDFRRVLGKILEGQ